MASVPPDLLSLDGRVAFVTGAGRGIGAATALAFGRAGARVALVDRDAEGLHRTVDELGTVGAEALGVRADVSDAGAIAAAVQTTVTRWGRLDILVNNAGIVRDA